ncbi:MAG: transglutaminase-like domain-containing protein [Ruminococcus flavefaciens]|nr:transglutaminase-like domain-containing protein [Ruminococcus flavefaciens]
MQKSNNRLKDFILKIVCDPVLIYTVIVMMSIMYHYKSEHTAIYGIVSFFIAGLSFRLFDYMTKHKFIGFLGYTALFMGFMYAVRFAIGKGSESYPLNFGVWFLTPQDVLEYSQWYTIAIFLLFMIFMMSVIYYFTRIRYRIFMGFLIFIIPFAIYGKEYEKMPTYFIIMLAVSYILIMIDFRQMQNTEEIEIVGKKNIWKSIAVYAVAFASLSAVIPKPEIEANRDLLDTLISAEQFTDRLTAMLGIFQDTTDGGQFRSNSNTPIYYVSSRDPMRLKLTTFSTYHYDSDSWSVEHFDKNFQEKFEYSAESARNGLYSFSETGSLTKAILHTAEINPDFAEKYGLSGLSAENITVPEKRWISITSNSGGAQFAPVPQLVQDFWSTSYRDEMALIPSGIIYANGKPNSRFSYDEQFVFSYTPDTFFTDSENKHAVDSMSSDYYAEMLVDAMEVADTEDFPIIYDEMENYAEYSDLLLDYGGSQKIHDLAQQITVGCTSDYDKATAIEAYFRENDYVYDLEYRKANGDNAEDFIFTAKRGVCYEYATAMVLLARASGIPARYCEGYNMSTLYSNNMINTNFIVTGNDAHGFPELYIRGFGWLSFEPTVSSEETLQQETTASDSLTRAGIIILITAVAVMMFVLIYPAVSHKLFILIYSRKSPNEAVTAVMQRIYRLSGSNTGYTSQETADFILAEWGADIHEVALLFDRAVYGEAVLNDTDKKTAMDSYIVAYQAYREKKRKRNRKTKKSV